MPRKVLFKIEDKTETEAMAENIEARRIRVAAQVQARIQEELGDEFQEKLKTESSQRQMEKSKQHMSTLKEDSTKPVTDVLVDADARELRRLEKVSKANRIRVEKLEKEAKSSAERFNFIMKKWMEDKEKVIDQELRQSLRTHQELCRQVIKNKNKLINDLQQEVKERGGRFASDRRKDADEMDLIIERMKEQISGLKKQYRKQMDTMLSTFDEEWKDLLTASKNKWDQKRNERSFKEIECLEQRMKMLEEYEVQLKGLTVENVEEYTKFKIKLESEVQCQEEELQAKKAIYLVHQEKVKHNTQKLKRFEEEYAISKGKHIRQITKLQDVRIQLKKKCAIQENEFQDETWSLNNLYMQLQQQYKDVQKRIRHFAKVDAKRYKDIWQMNEEKAKALACRVLDLDRVIHEQVLGVIWSPPSLPLIDYSRTKQPKCTPILAEKDDTEDQTAQKSAQESNTPEDPDSLESSVTQVDPETVKRLLHQLSDEMDFLLDTETLKLLSYLEKGEQVVLKLDLILSSLGIQSEDDLNKIVQFLLNYKQQQNKPEEVPDLIDPNDVLGAVRAFVDEHCTTRKIPEQKDSAEALEKINDSAVRAYWENISNIIPESRIKVWRMLKEGLKKYHAELKKTVKLLSETRLLEQKNSELQMLLHINPQVSVQCCLRPPKVPVK